MEEEEEVKVTPVVTQTASPVFSSPSSSPSSSSFSMSTSSGTSSSTSVVLGRKRLYAARRRMVGEGISLGGDEDGLEDEEDEPKEVYGAVRKNPNPTAVQHDEFGLIHRILQGSEGSG